MTDMPKDFDQLLDLHDALLDRRDAAVAAQDAADIADIDAQLVHVKSAVRRSALEGLAKQAEILSELAEKLKPFTQKALTWPFGSGPAPADHERAFKEPLPDNDFEDQGPDSPPPAPETVPADVIPTVSKSWSEEYQKLWENMAIIPSWNSQAEAVALKIVAGQSQYKQAVAGTIVPWWFVGIVHAMECSLRFDQHLHNGDPLSARTTHIPPGRPPTGSAPFTWVQSAQDAIIYDRLTQVTDWSLQSALYHWHRYNGINNAYKRNKIPTPYLWSGSTHYRKGKYVSDGKFDPDAVSQQVGAAVLLRKLIDLNAVVLSGATLVSNALAATGAPHLLTTNLSDPAFQYAEKELEFPGPLDIGAGSSGSSGAERALVRKVQEWLTLNDCDTGIDGDFGTSTATQLSRFRDKTGQAATGPLDEDTWAILTKPMREAVAVTKFAMGTSLEDAVVKSAQQHIRSAPREVGGQNRGPWVRIYMAGREGDAQKWCAGFISLIVAQAARDLDIGIPFARRVGVDALVKDAQNDGRFILGTSLNTPSLRNSHLKPGNLFVIRKSSSDWTHVGIVLKLNHTTFDTFEGNTSGNGGVDGGVARLFNRSYASKDFLRLQ